jgi:hypothetical protein
VPALKSIAHKVIIGMDAIMGTVTISYSVWLVMGYTSPLANSRDSTEQNRIAREGIPVDKELDGFERRKSKSVLEPQTH